MTKGNLWTSFFLNDSNVSEDFFGDRSTRPEGEITIKISVDPNDPETFPKGFVNIDALDTATDIEIELHKKEDEDQARSDALNKNA